MITIKADRPALQIERDGQTSKWEYDVVTLKLEIESLRQTHPQTGEFLQAFAKRLETHGLPEASADLAMRIEALVRVQFSQLSKSILTQLADMKD
jgi:hypothetical protein